MEGLTNTLSGLRSLSTKIIKKNIELMASNDLLADIQEEIKDVNVNEIKQFLFEFSELNTEEAEKVAAEIQKFSERLAKGKFIKEDIVNACPFLASVWYGDYYDEKGINGLLELEKELKSSLKLLRDTNMFEIICVKFRKVVVDGEKDE